MQLVTTVSDIKLQPSSYIALDYGGLKILFRLLTYTYKVTPINVMVTVIKFSNLYIDNKPVEYCVYI